MYNTLFVQHLICTTPHMYKTWIYNTSLVQNSYVQHLICTTPWIHNTWIYNTLNIQQLEYTIALWHLLKLYILWIFLRGRGEWGLLYVRLMTRPTFVAPSKKDRLGFLSIGWPKKLWYVHVFMSTAFFSLLSPPGYILYLGATIEKNTRFT